MVDYLKAGLQFKVRKVLRYVSLYGPSRTIVKVGGQRHMSRRFNPLPASDISKSGADQTIGLIGCGNFAFTTIAHYLSKEYGSVIKGAMDVDAHRAASLALWYKAAYYTDDPYKIIEDPDIKLVFIASNHASHAEYAISCLKAGKSVHIEKPHVVSFDQLKRLCAAMDGSSGKVNLGFNRPESQIGREIRRVLRLQSGTSMINWFIAGHAIEPDHWYFREEEGGRVLGNLCHWTDLTYGFVEPQYRYPIEISPTRSEQSDSNIAVTLKFGDGSIAAITFSAKGHTFEGVRELLSIHKGDAMIRMADFKELVVDDVHRRSKLRHRFREHGHRENVLRSVQMSTGGLEPDGLSTGYVWESGELFLKVKEALDRNATAVAQGYAARSGGDILANLAVSD